MIIMIMCVCVDMWSSGWWGGGCNHASEIVVSILRLVEHSVLEPNTSFPVVFILLSCKREIRGKNVGLLS